MPILRIFDILDALFCIKFEFTIPSFDFYSRFVVVFLFASFLAAFIAINLVSIEVYQFAFIVGRFLAPPPALIPSIDF